MNNMSKNQIDNKSTQYEFSFDYIQKKLEGKKDSFGMLSREIIRTGICTQCGTCASVCPVLEWDYLAEQPKLVGKCTGCGICYNQCPRTITDPVQLMGEFKTGYVANTNIPEVIGAQDGGTVTSILCYLFDEHLIDAAIVTMKNPNKPWYPIAQIVTTKEDAIKASGSIYCHSQTVEALMDAIRANYRSIAIVATPCGIDAVNKMMNSPAGMLRFFMRAHILKIGLFCMDSFSPEALYPFFQKDGIDLSKITKMDINKGKFHLYDENQEKPLKSYTIKELDKFKSSSCNFCIDLTAENADLSIGSVGSGANKNTVFARTGLGAEIIEDAAQKGYLKIESFGAIDLNSVFFLAKLKKVAQYTIQKRKVFIVKDMTEQEELIDEINVESKVEDIKILAGARKSLRIAKKLDKTINSLDFTITNTIGHILEKIKIRISTIYELFEKNVWRTTIKELFPYETIEVHYSLKLNDDEIESANVLLEASTEAYGKIFSKTFKLASN